MTADRQYLRADEIARLTGVSLRTVRRWIADEKLPSVKLAGVRLVAKKAVQQMLAPALRDWSEDEPECGDHTDAYDTIGK